MKIRKFVSLLVLAFGLYFVGCNDAVPVVTSDPNNGTTTEEAVPIDTSMLEEGIIEDSTAAEEDGDESDFPSTVVTNSRAAGISLSHFYNGNEVTASAWKKFAKQFQFYSRNVYASEYGDLMVFFYQDGELYFVYSFLNGVTDDAWNETTYAAVVNKLMYDADGNRIVIADGTLPEYGASITPPTCGRIMGVDTTGITETNGLMFLVANEHHCNWGKGYCYEKNGYTGYGDYGHTNCYMPMHAVFYTDGAHIRQACYAGYDLMVPECEFCTACFRERSKGLQYLPYNMGNWTYGSEYQVRSLEPEDHHLINARFKKFN